MIKWLWFQLLVSSYPFQELVWLILAGIQSKLSRQFINQKKSTITITSSMNKLVFENTAFTHTRTWCVHRREKKGIKTKKKALLYQGWSDTGALCPGCHGGGTAEAGAGGPSGELGKAHLRHEFSVAVVHPAMGTWGVQDPHTDVRGQGKTPQKDHSVSPSALCKMAPRLQIQPQRAKGCPGWHQGAAQHK